jgi:hypothetical protein
MMDERYQGTWHPHWCGWSYYVGDRVAGDVINTSGNRWLPRLAEWRGPDYPTMIELELEPADQEYIASHPIDAMVTMALAVARAADARTSAHVR